MTVICNTTSEERLMKLVLRAGFDRYSGYGNDAVDLAIHLQRAGVDVVPWPTSLLPGLPAEFTKLLEKNPQGHKDAVLQFSDPAQFSTMPEWADMAPKAFGYSMWERTPLLPGDLGWDKIEGTDWSLGRPFSGWLRGMAVTCPMNVEAFRHLDPDLAMTVVPCGIDSDAWPTHDRRGADRPMRFLLIGALEALRKDPFCVLNAWHQLTSEHPDFDAELIVHSFSPGLVGIVADGAYGPRVTFSRRPLSRRELTELYHSCDVLVTPSRGEGNNKPAMEFMATGGCVIASDWSGHRNWLHPDCTIALPGTLTPVDDQPEAQEFVVDPEVLAEAMLNAWRNPRLVRRLGDRAATWIREKCSWDVVVPKLADWMATT
jgi:glycosyltransferase involved in cell wall biosynthesis